jgi:hypothetical protein
MHLKEEHEDGSATFTVDVDKEAIEALVEKGVITLLKEYIELQKETYGDNL